MHIIYVHALYTHMNICTSYRYAYTHIYVHTRKCYPACQPAVWLCSSLKLTYWSSRTLKAQTSTCRGQSTYVHTYVIENPTHKPNSRPYLNVPVSGPWPNLSSSPRWRVTLSLASSFLLLTWVKNLAFLSVRTTVPACRGVRVQSLKCRIKSHVLLISYFGHVT